MNHGRINEGEGEGDWRGEKETVSPARDREWRWGGSLAVGGEGGGDSNGKRRSDKPVAENVVKLPAQQRACAQSVWRREGGEKEDIFHTVIEDHFVMIFRYIYERKKVLCVMKEVWDDGR